MTQPFRDPVDLDEATKLDGSDGEYGITLSDDWQLWGPSGGYLSSIALRAAGEISDLPRPVSFYCHFVRAPEFGPATVHARFVRRGRRSESIAVDLFQEGKLALTSLIRTAGVTEGFNHQSVEAPDAPPPAEVKEFRWEGPRSDEYTYWNNFERRPVTPWSPDPTPPVHLEWLRSIPVPRFEDPFIDAARPLLALDTFGYIAVNQAYPNQSYIAPNLDTSAWFHDIPAQTDWLLLDHSSPVARDGVLGVEGRVWSEDGRLVATGSAQLLQIDLGQPG